MKQLRISQCMIVKNEEKNIEQALSWGKDIMWEQIVVDTGSTDHTVELAEAMGAKVYHFAWIDDFSAAKNFACRQAKGDWIAFLDADEYMDAENVKRLYGLLIRLERSHSLCQAIVTNWFNVDETGKVFIGGNQIRIFRNRSGVHYQGRIHEYLVRGKRDLDGSELMDACDQLTIYHTGYTPQALAAGQKLERNRRMILKELEERPNDYKMLGNLADTYRAGGEYEEAVKWYEKAVAALPPAEKMAGVLDMRTSENFAFLLTLLCELRKEERRIRQTYEEALRYVPADADFDYIVGRHYAETGSYAKGAAHLHRALELLNQNGNVCYGMLLTANLRLAWEYLATCYYNCGQLKDCVSACVTLLQADRFAMGVLRLLLAAFLRDAKSSKAPGQEIGAANDPAQIAGGKQVLAFLGRIYDFSAAKDRIFVLRTAKDVSYPGLTQAVRELFTPEELRILDGMEKSGK